MHLSPRAHASPPTSCSAASTPSASPPAISSKRSASPAHIDASPTSERSQEPSQSPVSKKVTSKRTPKLRRHRNRPIHEIARLKQQIPVLESEVRVLWARADEIRRRQLLARAENADLKNRLRRSVSHAKLLEAKLQLYQRKTLESSMLPDGAVGRNLPFETDNDAQILFMLSQSVDDNYRKTRQVFEAAEMATAETELDDAKLLDAGDGSSVLQIRSIGLQPFGMQTVLRAMWQALEQQTVLKDEECTDIGLELGEASRVVVLKREIVLRGSDAGQEETPCVSCTIRVVLKQFLASGREIHVWDAFGDWPSAVSTREYGWSVIQPKDVQGANLTLVKNCIFMTSSTITSEEPRATRSAAQHSVARLYKQITQDRQRVVENALLDQTRHVER